MESLPHFSSFSSICNMKNRHVSVLAMHQDMCWFPIRTNIGYFPSRKPMGYSICEAQHCNRRERSCEKASSGGKGKSAGLCALPCENENQKPVTRMCMLGKITMKSETAVSIIACVTRRKLKCMYILEWAELFSDLKFKTGRFGELSGRQGLSVSAALSAGSPLSS